MPDEFDEFFAKGANGVVQNLNTTPDAPLLKGHTAPCHINKKERPVHRTMQLLAAQGYTNVEIAQMLGRTAVNVNNALRQPHSQQALANLIRDKVTEDQKVVQVIKDCVVSAVETLKEVMIDKDAPKAARIAAAEALLNRRYGKPNQPINKSDGVNLNSLSIAEVVAELPSTNGTGTDNPGT